MVSHSASLLAPVPRLTMTTLPLGSWESSPQLLCVPSDGGIQRLGIDWCEWPCGTLRCWQCHHRSYWVGHQGTPIYLPLLSPLWTAHKVQCCSNGRERAGPGLGGELNTCLYRGLYGITGLNSVFAFVTPPTHIFPLESLCTIFPIVSPLWSYGCLQLTWSTWFLPSSSVI